MAYLLIVDDDGDFAGAVATVLRTRDMRSLSRRMPKRPSSQSPPAGRTRLFWT